MALTLEDIMSQLGGLFGGGGSAATAYPQSTAVFNPNGGAGDAGLGSGNTFNLKQDPNATGFGMNIGTGQLGLQGLNSLSGIWSSMKANKLGEQSFKLNKQMANTNLNNQLKSYNTALEDKGRARAQFEGQDAATAQAYIDKNRLTR